MPTLDGNNNIVVTAADIRALFPEFADTTMYPDARIEADITIAGLYVSKKNYGDIGFDRRVLLIELMAAHLLKLDRQTGADGAAGGSAGGGATGLKLSATVGEVSVSYAVPEDNGALHFFLNQTTYGQRYAAFLAALASPRLYGGSFQRLL